MIAVEVLESIRATASARVVAEHLGVKPNRAGRSRCPVCKPSDRSEAFALSHDNRRWRCFRCQAHGDAIELVRATLGEPFEPAARIVAELCGIPSDTQFSNEEGARLRRAARERQHIARQSERQRAWHARAFRLWTSELSILRLARRMHGARLRNGEADASEQLARVADCETRLERCLDALQSTEADEVTAAVTAFLDDLKASAVRRAA